MSDLFSSLKERLALNGENLPGGCEGRARESQQPQEMVGICVRMKLLKFFQLSHRAHGPSGRGPHFNLRSMST